MALVPTAGYAYFKSRTKTKRRKKEQEKRQEGMKTALGCGSQHREKDVNDSGGKGINNAGLPLSLYGTVPLFLPLLHVLFSIDMFPFAVFCPHLQCFIDLTSRGSYHHQTCIDTFFLSCPAFHCFCFVHQLLTFLSNIFYEVK